MSFFQKIILKRKQQQQKNQVTRKYINIDNKKYWISKI